MNFPRVAAAIRRFLEAEGHPFAVVGGLGLHAYGVSRATFDLDLVTETAAQMKLVPFLESLGYQTLHRSAGYSNHQHTDAAMGRVDVIYVRDETGRRLFTEARERQVLPGFQALVPHPEHLIAMKIHAMANDPDRKLQELADIRRLLEAQALDRAEVRRGWSSMTSSKRASETGGGILDLERDLPTTPEDVEVLRRLRKRPVSPAEYAALLAALGDAPVEELKRRKGPFGEPFEL